MSVATLVSKLRASNIDVSLVDGNLEVSTTSDEFDMGLIAELKANKPALIAFLKEATAAGGSQQGPIIKPVPEAPNYEVSHAQKRLWILEELQQKEGLFTIPDAYELVGQLDKDVFQRAFQLLAERHESLRTNFIAINGQPRQVITPPEAFEFTLQYHDLRTVANAAAMANNFIDQEGLASFNLESGPLFRVKLLHIEAQKYIFIFNIHHIISDAWSIGLFIEELLTIYQAQVRGREAKLPALPIQYKDYAA